MFFGEKYWELYGLGGRCGVSTGLWWVNSGILYLVVYTEVYTMILLVL